MPSTVTVTPRDLPSHLGLAQHIALRYTESIPGGFDEALAIAYAAMVRAAHDFDPQRGRWSTFAGLYIQNDLRQIARAARQRDRSTVPLTDAFVPARDDPALAWVEKRLDWPSWIRRLRAQCSPVCRALLDDCLAYPYATSVERAARLHCAPSTLAGRFQRLRTLARTVGRP